MAQTVKAIALAMGLIVGEGATADVRKSSRRL
jgi:hypothetical protein